MPSSTTAPQPVVLLSQSEAARVLGVDRWTLAALVRQLGIEPKPVAWNGRAKGLDGGDMIRLRRAWERLRDAG